MSVRPIGLCKASPVNLSFSGRYRSSSLSHSSLQWLTRCRLGQQMIRSESAISSPHHSFFSLRKPCGMREALAFHITTSLPVWTSCRDFWLPMCVSCSHLYSFGHLLTAFTASTTAYPDSQRLSKCVWRRFEDELPLGLLYGESDWPGSVNVY